MKTRTRRQFLAAASAVVTLPVLSIGSRSAAASDLPELDPGDSQAKALGYVHESPRADNVCANCQLYTGGPDSAWGPCALFPGKQVAAAGWCSAWIEKKA